jgi:hypothetical protein
MCRFRVEINFQIIMVKRSMIVDPKNKPDNLTSCVPKWLHFFVFIQQHVRIPLALQPKFWHQLYNLDKEHVIVFYEASITQTKIR